MRELWNILAEITVEPQDFSGDTVGFMTIVTWAESAEAARIKIDVYFNSFNWHIVKVEKASPIKIDFAHDSEEFQEMVDRAIGNADAIICGTFHTYKVS